MENFAYNNVDYLELKSVSFGYNDNEVLHDVSMRLEKGGRYAIIGPSGSGKTTIINTITVYIVQILEPLLSMRACLMGSI